ncbi:MAG: patatin-like phospholipase family protein, partial [Candidatus Thorarchaeota archaeon]
MHILGELQIQYDIICGISVGALNGSFLGMFPKGEEVDAIARLRAIWDTVDDDRIYRQRYPIGSTLSVMFSVVSSKSLYDSTPLVDMIEQTLDTEKLKASGKKLRFGAVSLSTGEYREWSENDEDVVLSVAASSAFPGFFKPIKIDGEYWTDGGVKEVIPVRAAIEAGATQIDIIALSPSKNDRKIMRDVSKMNVVQGMPLILDVMSDEISDNDIETAYVH